MLLFIINTPLAFLPFQYSNSALKSQQIILHKSHSVNLNCFVLFFVLRTAVSGRFIGLAQLVSLGVVLDILHQRRVNAAALFYHQTRALIIEHPDFIAGVFGVGLIEDGALVQAAEFGASFGGVEQVAGAVIEKLILDRRVAERVPFLIGNIIYVVRL